MRILLGDETNRQYDPTGFLVYGGLIFTSEGAIAVTDAIKNVRARLQYSPVDSLKFDTRARPAHVSVEDATAAKNDVIQTCMDNDCVFIVHIIHHDIVRGQTPDDQIHRAADYVLSRYNMFLKYCREYGLVILDTLPQRSEFDYMRRKFQVGLHLDDGTEVPLDRILSFSSTCDGASHLSSAADIVLGSFRYCINDPRNVEAATEMMRNVASMMWHRSIGDNRYLGDRGLIFRPPIDRVRSRPLRQQYEELRDHIEGLIA